MLVHKKGVMSHFLHVTLFLFETANNCDSYFEEYF